jgi:hypothetical protein
MAQSPSRDSSLAMTTTGVIGACYASAKQATSSIAC